jgi:hypothetical protein
MRQLLCRTLLPALCATLALTAQAADAPAPAPALVPAPVAAPPVPVVPPSPSTAPGIRIWPDPAFTHWPAIAYGDEARNIAFSLPVKVANVKGRIGWDGEPALDFTTPDKAESISGLLPLPTGSGLHRATVTIVEHAWPLAVRVADAREEWPIASLKNGFPVDAQGVPVVLADRRRNLSAERQFTLLDGVLPRGTGRTLVVGDRLEAMGGDVWSGLDADQRPALDERYPQHAVLLALAKLPDPLPRTIVWCPGNQVLHGGAWSAEEERVLGVLRSRCEQLGALPRLILALPPLPLDANLRTQAEDRRDQLLRSATLLQWTVVDLGRVAGDPEQANRVAEGVFARYPVGAAQQRMREALKQVVER